MKICFIGDDLYQNSDHMKREVLGRCFLKPYEVDAMTSEELSQALLMYEERGCPYKIKACLDGIYWADYDLNEIARLNVEGIVVRTYEDAFQSLVSLDREEFNFYVVDLTFLGSREIAQEKLGWEDNSFSKYLLKYPKIFSSFGVLIAKMLLERGLPFIIFTTDIGHAREGLDLLVKEGICSKQEVTDVICQCEEIGWESWKNQPRLLISTNGIIAVGPKLHKKTWEMLLEFLGKKIKKEVI